MSAPSQSKGKQPANPTASRPKRRRNRSRNQPQQQTRIVVTRPAPKARSIEQRRPHKMLPMYEKVVKQIMSPASCDGDIIPAPNHGAAAVCARRYTRVVDFTPTSDHFTVVMNPDLYAPGLVTNKSAVLVPPVGTDHLSFTFPQQKCKIYKNEVIAAGVVHDTAGDAAYFKLEDIADGLSVTKRGFKCIVLASTLNYVDIQTTIEDEAAVKVEVFELRDADLHWHSAGAKTILAGGDWQCPVAQADNCHAIAIMSYPTVADDNVDGVPSNIKVYIDVGQYNSDTFITFAPAFGKQIIDKSITKGRVLGMSLKVTNTSNALSQGGNISIGRVPDTFTPFGDPSLEMSKLPANRKYQNCVTDGGYTFWMPSTLDEWEFGSIRAKAQVYGTSEFLLAYVSGLPAGCSFRLTFGWVVEFYTENENFPKVPTPDWTDDFEHVVSMMLQMDAASCNPASASIFNRFLESGKRYVNGAQKHYSDNKQTYDLLLQLARSLGLASF